MTQQEELRVLFPNTDISLSSGETLTIKPFTFGQLTTCVELTKNLVGLIQQVSKTSDEVDHVHTAMTLLGGGGEDLIKLLMFATKKDRAWFDELPVDDGVNLTAQFLGVNYDFFTQRVLPAVKKGMEKFRATTPAVLSS